MVMAQRDDLHQVRIGLAGCGRMGQPMAEALLRHGFNLKGFDTRPPEAFGDFAPHMVSDPARFAAETEILFTVVRDQAQTEALLFTDQALMARPNAVRTLIISSTLSPAYLDELAARMPARIALVDAPMSGAHIAAREERLSFMLGGTPEIIQELMPLFTAMGTKWHHIGAFGAGMRAKVLNNFVAAAAVTATRQALELAEKLDIDRKILLDVMHDSSGQTWFGSNFERIEFARDGYDGQNSIGVLAKDVSCLIEALGDEAAPTRQMAEIFIETLKALKPVQPAATTSADRQGKEQK